MSNTTTKTVKSETVAVKRPVGRPRLYNTDAERKAAQKAANERHAAKVAAERDRIATIVLTAATNKRLSKTAQEALAEAAEAIRAL